LLTGFASSSASSFAQESLASSEVNVGSTTLGLPLMPDAGSFLATALRFPDIQIPTNGIVSRAWIQFTPAQADSSQLTLALRAEPYANPSFFAETSFNVTDRQQTQAEVTWSPDAWTVGTTSVTANIAPVIQEIISQASWYPGKTVVIFVLPFDLSMGSRLAKSDSFSNNPMLFVEWEQYIPVSNSGGSGEICVPDPLFWNDVYGDTCDDYESEHFCTASGGYGNVSAI
jgi:hypothetical protein